MVIFIFECLPEERKFKGFEQLPSLAYFPYYKYFVQLVIRTNILICIT